MITALEIFTEPKDLEISVTKRESDGKYGVLITRGPGHRFKILVSSPVPFDSREHAVDSIKSLLDSAREASLKELTNANNTTAQIVNPDNNTAEEMNGLTADRVNWIVKELTEGRTASTYR